MTVMMRLWFEDGVWNGVAEDLPVAVFAGTREEAETRLRAAIVEHLKLVMELRIGVSVVTA